MIPRRIHLLDYELADGRRVAVCGRWESPPEDAGRGRTVRLNMTIDPTDATCAMCLSAIERDA